MGHRWALNLFFHAEPGARPFEDASTDTTTTTTGAIPTVGFPFKRWHRLTDFANARLPEQAGFASDDRNGFPDRFIWM
jgi:hypothetical protein